MNEVCLLQKAREESERARNWKIQFELDLISVLSLCGNLQLALRHPLNTGPSSELARQVIADLRAGLKDRGFEAHAEMIALGDDPANDYDPRLPKRTPRLTLIQRAYAESPLPTNDSPEKRQQKEQEQS